MRRPTLEGVLTALPPFTVGRAFTDWTVDPVLLIALVGAAAAYLAGVRRLRARGDAWPVGRTIAWLTGLGIAGFATMSGLGTYDTTLFSVHMGQHMLLNMIVPVPLALAAPVTLALRTLPLRPRKLLLSVLHSRVAAVLTFPLLTFVLFVGSTFALYFTGLYEYSLEHPWFHELVHVHFLAVGCLFFWPLIGLDPLPGRPPHWVRMFVLFMALPFHAFLGLAIMGSTNLLGGTYYVGLHPSWGASPLSDQHTGGGLLWASGDIVGLLVFFFVLRQWMAAEAREAVRTDRALDRRDAALAARSAVVPGVPATMPSVLPRSGGGSREDEEDAALEAYNQRLAALAARNR